MGQRRKGRLKIGRKPFGLINSRYNIANLQPEKLCKNIFNYNAIILPNEIEMINKKISEIPSDGGMPLTPSNNMRDLQLFFKLHDQRYRESQINYFLIKKWLGREYKKKRKNNPMALIYLSVDFYYSIYVVKTTKKKKISVLKACFPAENSEIKAKPLEKIIEISYTEKGLIWDSKKKIILELNRKQIDEFALHHQQAKILYTSSSRNKTNNKKNIQPLYQSSIITKGGYQDVTKITEPMSNSSKFKKKNKITTILENNLTTLPSKRLNTSANRSDESEEEYNLEESNFKFHPFMLNSNPQKDLEISNFQKYDENLDEIEKNYTSEKMIIMDDPREYSSTPRELDYDMLEQVKAEIMLFKKEKIKMPVDEDENDSFDSDNLSVGSAT